MAEVRATPLPGMGGQRRPVLDQAVARPTSYSPTMVGRDDTGDTAMNSLLTGLSSVNSNLGAYTQQAIQARYNANILERDRNTKLAEQIAGAEAALTPEGSNIEGVIGGDVPAGVPVAFSGVYREALGSALVSRQAIKLKQEWATAYEQESKAEDFNVDKFRADFRAKHLGGLTNPALIGQLGASLSQMEGALLAADEKKRVQKLEDETNAGLYAALQENFTFGMTPEEMGAKWMQQRVAYEALGKSKAELNSMFLGRLSFLSNQVGGDPAIFDAVINTVDPDTGMTLLAHGGTQMQEAVLAQKEKAKQQLKVKLEADTQQANFKSLDEMNKLMETDPAAITEKMVWNNTGEHGVFRDFAQAANYLAQARRQAAERGANQALMGDLENGMAGRWTPEVQKKLLEGKYGSVITAMWRTTVGADGAVDVDKAGELGKFLVEAHDKAGATVGMDGLVRLIETTLTSSPAAGGISGQFMVAHTLWKALSANPKYRDMYFKEGTADLMRNFSGALGDGSNPQAAYDAAYRAGTPEAREAAKETAKSEPFKKALKATLDEVTGVGFMQRWFGIGTEVQNVAQLQAEIRADTADFLSRNPTENTPEKAAAYAKERANKRFVMDSVTGQAVKVPQGMADENMQKGLEQYSTRLIEINKATELGGGSWSVQYRPAGSEGLVNVVMTNGSAEKNMGIVPLQSIRDAYVHRDAPGTAEFSVVQQLNAQMAAGTADPQFLMDNATLIELAKAKGMFRGKESELQKLEDVKKRHLMEKFNAVPRVSLGQPTFETLQHVQTRGAKVDNKLTANIALEFSSVGHMQGMSKHAAKAASMITMGEAAMSKAYPDPAKDAGMNVGMGYNLKANAQNYRKDFISAGVAPDMVEAVAKGEAQLTPAQMKKLLTNTMPRYENLVKKTADQTPGLWERMTDAQKAVMIDVAWQTGNPDSFKKAWSALASGDSAKFAEETKVFFTNRSGERVEDKRRNDLRAAMLNGDGQWIAAINRYQKFPSNEIERLALNQAK